MPRLGQRSATALLAALWTTPCAAQVSATIGTCTVVVTDGGTIAPTADLRTLSTTAPGGRPGRVHVSATLTGGLTSTSCSLSVQVNCFRVSVVPPPGFSQAPAGGNNAVTFAGGLRRMGSGSLLDLLSIVILFGDYDFDVSLAATKSTGAFTAGFYRAEQTVRCE